MPSHCVSLTHTYCAFRRVAPCTAREAPRPKLTIQDEPDKKKDELPTRFMQVAWLPLNQAIVSGMGDGSLRVYDVKVS